MTDYVEVDVTKYSSSDGESKPADLWGARNLDGSQRFYPFGEHPAGTALREQLVKLETLMAALVPWEDAYKNAYESATWIAKQLAILEAGEERAKRQWLEQAWCAS